MKPCGILPKSLLPTNLWDGQIKNETLNPYAMVPKEIWSGKGLDELFKIVLLPLLHCCPIHPASLYLPCPCLVGVCALWPSISSNDYLKYYEFKITIKNSKSRSISHPH